MDKQKRPLGLNKHELTRLKKVGLRVRQVRESKRMTLEDVVQAGYPSWVHLSAVEGGKKNIALTTLYRISEALGVSVAELLKSID